MSGVELSISDVIGAFPDYRVAAIVAEGLSISKARSAAVDAYVKVVEADLVASWGERPVSELAEVSAWRQAYKGFGIRKTSYRPSVERLIRHIQRHGTLPAIHPFVDLYNAVSVKFRMPAGADDLDRVTLPLAFRYSAPADTFIALGDTEKREDPPKEGEVVYADARQVLCRRWNWYQDDRTATSVGTRRAIVTVQAIGANGAFTVEEAASELTGLLEAEFGARVAWAVADRNTPMLNVPA